MSSTPEAPKRDRAYRLVVAEDAYLIREGIRSALEREEDEVEVLEYCADLPSLLEAVETHKPDVVITDIRMPPTSTDEGIRAAAALRESNPEIGVLVISQYVSPHYALKLFEHGSAGRAYLLKERVGHRIQLMEGILKVAAGGSVVDPKVVDVLVEARMRVRNSPLTQLTKREREVLAGVASESRTPRSPSPSSSRSARSRRTSTRCSPSSASPTTRPSAVASGLRCSSSQSPRSSPTSNTTDVHRTVTTVVRAPR